MYSALPKHSLAEDVDYHGLVLSSGPKLRLRWTADLHDRFIDAVAQLGGADSQSPCFPGNARMLYDKRWDNNSSLGKVSRRGLAPILCSIIFLMLPTYLHSVVTDSDLQA